MNTISSPYSDFMDAFTKNSYTEEELRKLRELIEVSTVEDINELSSSILKGQYRLSYRLLEKLFLLMTNRITQHSNTSAQKRKKSEQKITKMELLLLIIILQMCDSNNKLYDFSYSSDIAPLKDYNGEPLFCKSTFYCIYTSLQRKKIIQVKEETDGTVTLSVPDNHIGKNDKYITLQTEFLLHDSEQYLSFRNMKLGAMKLYLFALAQTYTGAGSPLNEAPAISVEQIKTRLGVTQNRTVRTYIMSLEKAFGKLNFSFGGGRNAFAKGKVRFSNRSNKFCFARRTTLSAEQPNSFRRFFDKTILKLEIEKDPHYDMLRTWTFMLMSSIKEDHIKDSFSFLILSLLSHNKLDRLSFTDAAEKIANAYSA